MGITIWSACFLTEVSLLQYKIEMGDCGSAIRNVVIKMGGYFLECGCLCILEKGKTLCRHRAIQHILGMDALDISNEFLTIVPIWRTAIVMSWIVISVFFPKLKAFRNLVNAGHK